MSRFASSGLPLPAVLVDGGDVTDGKPSPEGYLLAARLLRVDAADCLVVEDAPAGVRAGKAAGMTLLAVASTHDPAELAEADDARTSLAEATPAVLQWLRPEGTPVPGGRCG
jgi:sugar-phosphatase